MTTTVHGLDELAALAGTTLGPTAWHEVTQDQVTTFADATGDHQWIHTDPERAAAGPFGGTIAHGYLTLSLIIPLWSGLLDLQGIRTRVNYGLNKVRFPAPVPVGARVRLTAHLAAVDRLTDDSAQTTVDFTVDLEGGARSAKPAVVAQALYRYYA
ncbi:MaoC family dehydratase [Actinophytocola algeriensis]|uniref:Acyl dehydratase n=1 Tax=Actinophytocola algeriensis TaxID=1768010 RepID=A0A7W7VCF1_9PSEU|nr:MaoC family dehydratase [Actinophytocola algeriensis]MBB4905024.1 acyl dehydratase [Actinophytocola algeriensis]MBE1476116.1 acyl dehydratase [Actinophytocola algeriensis]